MRFISPLVLCLSLLGACAGTHRPDGQTGLLPVGSQAPALTAPDQRGQTITLRSQTPTLVYFYPRDGTPGCTKEACALRDAWERYERAHLRVIGVSTDSLESHRAFAKEHNLPFALVSDGDHAWSSAFGVGSFAGLDSRQSFLIDAKDQIVKAYDDVDPGVHADQVLTDAKALGLISE
jgi:peroxiredoxin Q/BCP